MRRSVPLTLALLAALALGACSKTFAAGAAVVNGVSISQELLDRRVKAEQQAGAPGAPPGTATDATIEQQRTQLLQLISEELIRQEVARRNIVIEPGAIEQQIASFRGPQTEAEFEAQVIAAGLTLDELEDQIRLSLAVEEIRDTLVPPVTDADARQVYQISRPQFEQLRISHILFSVDDDTTEKEAERLARSTRVELQAGKRFAALARTRSDDPGSARSGGRLPGWISIVEQSFDQTFLQAAVGAKVGKVTEPVRTQFGFHLILVTDRRVQTFEQVKGQIIDQLQSQSAQTAFADFLGTLRSDAEVVVNPRFGDWDPGSGSIAPHTFFQEPQTTGDGDLPPPVELPGLVPTVAPS